MKRFVVITCVVVMATCVSIPSYVSPLAVGWDETTHTMLGSNFAVHIGNGFAFPDTLVLGGTNLLATQAAGATCNNEDGVGIALYPAPRISANSASGSDMDQVDVPLYGPAVTKVQIHWATTLCGTTHMPHGYTTFSIFPDGRIARFDQIADPSSESLMAANCACVGSGAPWYVTSFWAFDPRYLDQYFIGSGSPMPSTMSGPAPNPAGTDRECLQGTSGGQRAVAIGWSSPTPVETRAVAHPGAIALVEDLLHQDPLPMFDSSVTTTVLLHDGVDCTALDRTLDDYMAAPPLIVNQNPVNRSGDGIYGGDDTGLGGGIAANGTVTIRGQVNTPFAVALAFSNPNTGVRVTRDPSRDGPWYIEQRMSEYLTILWFRDGLMNDGGIVTVEPE